MGHSKRSGSQEVRKADHSFSPGVHHLICAKRLLNAGSQLTEVAAILGREDLNMTRRYPSLARPICSGRSIERKPIVTNKRVTST